MITEDDYKAELAAKDDAERAAVPARGARCMGDTRALVSAHRLDTALGLVQMQHPQDVTQQVLCEAVVALLRHARQVV